MLTKRNLGRGKVRVTFTMPPLDGVEQLNLVGDFNNWSITETPMARDAGGAWTASVMLAGGRDYQFRYLANCADWHNDWLADSYQPNGFGSDNSVVSLRPEALPTRRAPGSGRKKAAA